MITDTILHKYLRHLRYIDQGAVVHIDAVELALRLALDELAASTPSTQSTNGQAERDRDALAAEVHDLRSQLTQLEADNAAMIRRNKELADALHIAQNGTGLAIKNPPFVDPAPSAISNHPSTIQCGQTPPPSPPSTTSPKTGGSAAPPAATNGAPSPSPSNSNSCATFLASAPKPTP